MGKGNNSEVRLSTREESESSNSTDVSSEEILSSEEDLEIEEAPISHRLRVSIFADPLINLEGINPTTFADYREPARRDEIVCCYEVLIFQTFYLSNDNNFFPLAFSQDDADSLDPFIDNSEQTPVVCLHPQVSFSCTSFHLSPYI